MTTRRDFLRCAGAGLLTPFLPGVLCSTRLQAAGSAAATVFPLSVASGDPSPSGVILWTRINPDVYQAHLPLFFEVDTSPNFENPLVAGEVNSADFGAQTDYTVRLDLEGWLQPHRLYYYRFLYGDVASRTGRCRTLPAANQILSSLRLAVVTCQDFTNGYYGAFAHIAQDDVHFVLHLGDQIYETSGDPGFQPLPYADRSFELPSGQPAAMDLEDFRFLYRLYRRDPWYQRMLERHTLIALWDDHETANDCYWDYDRDTLGAPDHPLVVNQPNGGSPQALRQLKLAAQQAWCEYIPSRTWFDPQASHPWDALQIYRRFQFGSLVDLYATDERTYRSPHPCGADSRVLTTGCGTQSSAAQTMLGEAQRTWLVDGISQSPAVWKVWANEVFLGQLKLGRGRRSTLFFNLDAWDGYEAERQQILSTFIRRRVKNLVALTGDLHTYIAAYLKVDYSLRSNRPGMNLAGVEFMTPSVTSSTLVDLLMLQLPQVAPQEFAAAQRSGSPRLYFQNLARATNPHIHFFDSQEYGYSIVEFTPTDCVYSAFGVDTTRNSPHAARRLVRMIRVPAHEVKFEDLA